MKRVFYLFFLLLFSKASLTSQIMDWSVAVNPGSRMCIDPYKNLYNYTGYKIEKRDSTGTLIWDFYTPYNMKVKGIVCSADSSFYLIGNFTGAISGGSTSLVSFGHDDIFVSRYTPSGTIVWLSQIGGSGPEEAGEVCMYGLDIVITGRVNGTIQVFGQTVNTIAENDLLVAKCSSSGSISALKFGGKPNTGFHQSFAVECASGPNNEIYILGWSTGQVYIDSFLIASSPSGVPVFFVVKFDQALNLQWKYSLPTGSVTNLYSYYDLELNSSGESYVIQDCDLFDWSKIHKLSSSGGYSGEYSFPVGWAGSVKDMCLDSCDNIYGVGYETVSIWPTYEAPIIFRLNKALKFNWERRGATTSTYGSGKHIRAFGANDLVFVLHLSSTWCMAGLQVQVGLPINITPTSNLTLCHLQTTVLTFTSGGTVSWYNNPNGGAPFFSGNSFTVPIIPAGVYTCYVAVSNCYTVSPRVPITFTIKPSPTVSLNSGVVCRSSSFTLHPIVLGAFTYTFSSNSTVVTPSVNTSYSLTAVNNMGCTNSAVCYVTVAENPTVNVVTSHNFMCKGDTAVLNATGAQTYSWTGGPASNTFAVSPPQHTYYYVTGTDANGCVNTASITQFVTECVGITSIDRDQGIEIYPNPSNGEITVSAKNAGEMVIHDALGRVVWTMPLHAGEARYDVRPLASGIYYIEIRGAAITCRRSLVLR
jgi:hypothetical protein